MQAHTTTKRNLCGIGVDAVQMDEAVDRVMGAAQARLPLSVSALASHGVMTGVSDSAHRRRLNEIDLVVPDGQPVRWGINWLYGEELPDRVAGPHLMERLLSSAEKEGLSVFLYGSSEGVLGRLQAQLARKYPHLEVAGVSPSRFRAIGSDEQDEVAAAIRDSGASLCFVGLGCPRQEEFVWGMRDRIPCPLLAVGAAFDIHAGLLKQPPAWVQRAGLHWFQRLLADPRRLWHRYLVLGTSYLVMLAAQKSGVWDPSGAGRIKPDRTSLPG